MTAPRSTSKSDRLHVELIEVRGELEALRGEVQLVVAMLDEVLSTTKVLVERLTGDERSPRARAEQ